MRGFRGKAVAVVVALAVSFFAMRSQKAYALDLASSTAATVGGVVAIVGAVMMGKPESEGTGKTMLITGLVVSAVCSGSAVLLNVLALATLQASRGDKILQLEREAEAGGGPLVDGIATAFGASPSVVIASIRRAQKHFPAGTAGNDRAFAEFFLADLGMNTRLTESMSTRLLFDLQTERANLGAGSAPRHEMLAELVGVKVDVIAPIVAAHLDRALARGKETGKVISARTALSRGATATLDGLVTEIAAKYERELSARAQKARDSSVAYRALIAAQ